MNIFSLINTSIFQIKTENKMFKMAHCLIPIARNQIRIKYKLLNFTTISPFARRSYAISKLNNLIFECTCCF